MKIIFIKHQSDLNWSVFLISNSSQYTVVDDLAKENYNQFLTKIKWNWRFRQIRLSLWIPPTIIWNSFCQSNLKSVFCLKLRSAEECGTEIVPISSLQRGSRILLVLAGRGRQFSGTNALITTQERVQWRLDIQSASENFIPLKLGLVGGWAYLSCQ